MNANLAIAQCMGKDKYFAQKIHENEQLLPYHGHLPPSKAFKKGGQWTLLVENRKKFLEEIDRYSQ